MKPGGAHGWWWRGVALLGLALALSLPSRVEGGCNVIPLKVRNFNGVKGLLNRPYAAPGEPVQIGLRTCDGAPFGTDSSQYIVNVVFQPKGSSRRHLVALTNQPCANIQSQVNACTQPNITAECRQISTAQGLVMITSASDPPRLSFPFPSTDTVTGGAGFAGPAAISVTPYPTVDCGLTTGNCAAQTNVIACIDDVLDDSSACTTTSTTYVFSHFTALPKPNVFGNECADQQPPCQDKRTQLRIALDQDDNALIPVNWQSVLAGTSGTTLRLVRAALKWDSPIIIPSRDFIASYSWEGLRLPPIFDPIGDPNGLSDVVRVFGSTDAPYSVLRISSRVGVCGGGTNAGLPCSADVDCLGGTCPTVCVSGSNAGDVCTTTSDCPGGRCGRLFDLSGQQSGSGVGPVLFKFNAAPRECRKAPYDKCTSNSDCPGGSSDVCGRYVLQSSLPVRYPVLQTEQLSAFVVQENLDRDENGDGDKNDQVIMLQDRITGLPQNIGASGQCGLTGNPLGRAVMMGQRYAFLYPHADVEGSVLAFLESEKGQNNCDIDGDGNTDGAILRVFTLGPVNLTDGNVLAASTDPAINYRSLVVSGGRVFFRLAKNPNRLLVWDTTGSANPRRLCPATTVAVSGGIAAYLRPESNVGNPACPAGSLNGDTDVNDNVVQLWSGSAMQNLARAATGVSVSPTWLAAMISEAGESGANDPEVSCSSGPPGDRNCDGDATDNVLAVYQVGSGPWKNVGQAAKAVEVAGNAVVFLTPEADQGTDLNGDNDLLDDVLQLYYPERAKDQLVNLKQQAKEFVVGDPVTCKDGMHQFVAFRTNLAAQGPPQNGSPNPNIDVLQVVDLMASPPTPFGPHQAVTPCLLDACDPRRPYRVSGRMIRFLTPTNGNPNDVVLQTYDACEPTSSPITLGTLASNVGSAVLPPGAFAVHRAEGMPDQLIDPLLDQDGTQLFYTTPPGRCIPTATAPLNACTMGTLPDLSRGDCVLPEPASCDTGNACPYGFTCDQKPVLVSFSPTDLDADGIPDEAQSTQTIASVVPTPAEPGCACRLFKWLPCCRQREE